MKNFICIAIALTIGASAFAAVSPDTDILVWSIDIRANENVYDDQPLSSVRFTDISQFYLQSTETGDKIYIAPYTYTDKQLNTKASLSLNDYRNQSSRLGRTGSYYTDIGALLDANGIGADNYDTYEFIMQLDNNGNMVAWSEHLFDPSNSGAAALYLSDVYSSFVNPSTLLDPKLPSAFNFGSHLVPEPTSGLLMMLGAGLLALRRRRRA